MLMKKKVSSLLFRPLCFEESTAPLEEVRTDTSPLGCHTDQGGFSLNLRPSHMGRLRLCCPFLVQNLSHRWKLRVWRRDASSRVGRQTVGMAGRLFAGYRCPPRPRLLGQWVVVSLGIWQHLRDLCVSAASKESGTKSLAEKYINIQQNAKYTHVGECHWKRAFLESCRWIFQGGDGPNTVEITFQK